MSTVGQDVRYALRTLIRSPGFATIAIMTLGLGIGAATTIFTVVNGVLLRPLPYRSPERIANIWVDFGVGAQSLPAMSPADFRDYQQRSQSFELLAAGSGAQLVGAIGALSGDGIETERVEVSTITANFFPLLGVDPAYGRHFTAEEEAVGGPKVVILSYNLWRRRVRRLSWHRGSSDQAGRSRSDRGRSHAGGLPAVAAVGGVSDHRRADLEAAAIRLLDAAATQPDVLHGVRAAQAAGDVRAGPGGHGRNRATASRGASRAPVRRHARPGRSAAAGCRQARAARAGGALRRRRLPAVDRLRQRRTPAARPRDQPRARDCPARRARRHPGARSSPARHRERSPFGGRRHHRAAHGLGGHACPELAEPRKPAAARVRADRRLRPVVRARRQLDHGALLRPRACAPGGRDGLESHVARDRLAVAGQRACSKRADDRGDGAGPGAPHRRRPDGPQLCGASARTARIRPVLRTDAQARLPRRQVSDSRGTLCLTSADRESCSRAARRHRRRVHLAAAPDGQRSVVAVCLQRGNGAQLGKRDLGWPQRVAVLFSSDGHAPDRRPFLRRARPARPGSNHHRRDPRRAGVARPERGREEAAGSTHRFAIRIRRGHRRRRAHPRARSRTARPAADLFRAWRRRGADVRRDQNGRWMFVSGVGDPQSHSSESIRICRSTRCAG